MKNIIIGVLVALCAFFAYKWITKPVSLINPSTVKIAESGRELVDIDVENINRKVNKDGIESALFEDKQAVSGKRQLDDSSRNEIDSIERLRNIENKRWIAYTNVLQGRLDSALQATNHGDSLFTYSDPYASLSFNLPKETFSLRYDADINIAEYWDRKWFLAPKKRYVELWLSDPRATIRGVKRMRIEPKPDNFDLTLKGSAQYHLNDVGLGGKIDIRVGRVTGSGSYLYYPSYDDWKPAFSLDYEIGGF